MKFKLKSTYKPIPDQENAIKSIIERYKKGSRKQVLLGVTGSGKTFSVANVIERLQMPALIISHNKTLAAQLYQEFRDFFPENAVSYFVSYYDFYQPEAYIPSTDTYIEKDSAINELIDKLRLAATSNLLTRKDTIVIASVSCIYNIGSPREYGKYVFEFTTGLKVTRKYIIDRLINLQYERSDFGFRRGTFRVRGDTIDIYPAYKDEGIRLIIDKDRIINIDLIDTLTGASINPGVSTDKYILYPAKHYITDPNENTDTFKQIEIDLNNQCSLLEKQGKKLEAFRLKQRVKYDLEMIKEVGYVKGIENYSRYFDGRKPGDPPYSLLDYFNEPYGKDWLLFVDESHITFPQVRGMYNGDLSRKKTLIDYGFRLPAALDNRPLMFEEFLRKIPGFVATSATPSEWEINMANEDAKNSGIKAAEKGSKNPGVVQQLLRPTGIPDPEVDIRPVNTEVKDVIDEIKIRANPVDGRPKERSLVTTLTKKTAEDLSNYLKEQGILVHYLHSDIATLERTNILEDLRLGNYDCIVGVNLLREGLDLPEVSLVAILDADKEGFLRSEVSLTQTMGRAARHVDGKVILYADKITDSMKRALDEIDRRRKYQIEMNKVLGITPKSIEKPIRSRLVNEDKESDIEKLFNNDLAQFKTLPDINSESLTPIDRERLITKLRREMKITAQDLNFEMAAEIRDKIKELEF